MELEFAEMESVGAPPTVTVTLCDNVPPAGLLHVIVYVFVDVRDPVEVLPESV